MAQKTSKTAKPTLMTSETTAPNESVNFNPAESVMAGTAQKIYAQQKFMAGVKPDVRPGILEYNDHTFIYVCGNNVVIQELGLKDGRYHLVKNSQHWIQGLEGADGITAIALSPCKRFLAVCEKSKQAICSIFDPNPENFPLSGTQKRKRCLTSTDFKASEFIACAFADTRKNEVMSNFLATLTGDPDYGVAIWLFEKSRFVAHTKIGINLIPNQVSFKPDDNCCLVVTGKDVYRYFKIGENFALQQTKSLFGKDVSISKNYTCHVWIDTRLILCTARGDILIGDTLGEFKFVLPESPGSQFPIRKIVARDKIGFVIADDSGRFKSYEQSQDPKSPFQKSVFEMQIGSDAKAISHIETLPVTLKVDSDSGEHDPWAKHLHSLEGAPFFPLTSLELVGEYLIFTTENRQIMKMSFNYEKPKEIGQVSFLTLPFHSETITGIATCLKRSIVVTSSKDKTLRVWEYSSSLNIVNLEICQTFHNEISALALHPSGNYIIASFDDVIQFLSIYPKELRKFHEIPITFCNEIKFSNQGHLVAFQKANDVLVYRFFTASNPDNYIFSFHKAFVKSITWTEDDSGFVSTSIDNIIAVWALPKIEGSSNKDLFPKKNEPIWTYRSGITHFLATVSIKQDVETKNKDNKKGDKIHVVFAAASDNSIHEIHFTDGQVKLEKRYEMNVTLSQLLMFTGRKCLIAGVNQPRKPGSLMIIPYPFSNEKPAELQVHSMAITKMQINFEHTFMFTASQDGSFAYLSIKDEDHKRKRDHFPIVHLTEQVVIPKWQRTEILESIKYLEQDIDVNRASNKASLDNTVKLKNQELKVVEDNITECETNQAAKMKRLDEVKQSKETENRDEKLIFMARHRQLIEKMQSDHLAKTAQDETKYQELLQLRKTQNNNNSQVTMQMIEHQAKTIRSAQVAHQDENRRLAEEIKELIKVEQEIREVFTRDRAKKEEDTWGHIDLKVVANKEELSLKIEEGLNAKGELTRKQKEMRDMKNQKDGLVQECKNKTDTFSQNVILIKKFNDDILQASNDIIDRDDTLDTKKLGIMELKKKIQELEKFKFVLDYKINELRREVDPRNVKILELNEKATKMKSELKHFNRVNSNLTLIVQDMRMRQEGLKKELCEMRKQLAAQEQEKKMAADNVLQIFTHSLGDFKKLKKAVISLYRFWVLNERNQIRGDSTDVFEVQKQKRKQLENSVTVLRGRLNAISKNFKKENKRIVKENVVLIQEINHLKQEEKKLSDKLSKIENVADIMPSQKPPRGASRAKSARAPRGGLVKRLQDENTEDEQLYEALKVQLMEYDAQVEMLAERLNQRRQEHDQKTQPDANDANDDNMHMLMQVDANDGQTAEENYSDINRSHSVRQFEESPGSGDEDAIRLEGESPVAQKM